MTRTDRNARMTDSFNALSFLERRDPANTEGLTTSAGTPLAERGDPAGWDDVIEALRQVHDPEIPVDICDLGLIYQLDVHDAGDVAIVLTLTASSCPVAGEIPKMVAEAATSCPNVGRARARLARDPPWTRDMMSEDGRLTLSC